VAVPAVVGVIVIMPLVARAPLQLPEAVQPDVFTEDHEIDVEALATTDGAASDRVGAPGGTKASAASAWTKPKPELKL